MNKVRSQFPQINVKARGGNPFIYFDSAATTLKPQKVIEAVTNYYSSEVSNVHRGAHFLADRGTQKFEAARETVAKFIGAKSAEEIIFTRGTTESINLVASSFGESLQEGDEILLTEMEHHSNIVPWQLLAERKGLKIKVCPIFESGEIDLEAFKELLNVKTKIASFVSVSNALGTVNPVKEMISACKLVGAATLVDAAQSVSALPLNVSEWDCDFLAFSGHKVFAPSGIGVLYGKKNKLNTMPPYQSGGSMIDRVSFEGTTFLPAPNRFEAGTPHVAGVVGLNAALEFVNEVGLQNIYNHEKEILNFLNEELSSIEGVRLIGTAKNKINVISFLLEGSHPSDVGHILDQQGIAVRTGHHCCQPLMDRFKIPGTVRASLSVYNSLEDAENFVKAVKKAKEFF